MKFAALEWEKLANAEYRTADSFPHEGSPGTKQSGGTRVQLQMDGVGKHISGGSGCSQYLTQNEQIALFTGDSTKKEWPGQ